MSRRSGAVVVFITAFAAVVLYLPTLSFGYVNLDDPWLIRDNAELSAPTAATIRRLFTDFSLPFRLRMGSEYLPVRDVSVMVDFAVWGPHPARFHLTQVLLHAALAGLVAWTTAQYARRADVALVTGVLFAVHPSHVEAVAWLSERKGLLSGFFAMLAALAFHRLRALVVDSVGVVPRARLMAWFIASAVCCVMSVWSKAVGITTVPMIALLALAFPAAASIPAAKKRALAAAVVVLALVSAAAFVPVIRTGSLVHMVQTHPSWTEKIAVACGVVGHYARQLIPTGPYAILYPLDRAELPSRLVVAGALLLFVALGMCVRVLVRVVRERTMRVSVAEAVAALMLVFVAPVSHLLTPLQNLVADRYMLMLSFPAVLGVAWGLTHALRPRLAVGAVLSLALAEAFVATNSASAWSATSALYRNALEVNPGNAELMLNIAIADREDGRTEQAEAMLARAERALASHRPADPELLGRIRMHRALMLRAGGDQAAALVLMAQAAEVPSLDVASANFAHLLLEARRPVEARVAAERAVRIRPQLARNQSVLGRAALAMHDEAAAVLAFRRAIELEPRNANHYYNLGVALALTPDGSDRSEAIAAFRRALALDPANAAPREALRALGGL